MGAPKGNLNSVKNGTTLTRLTLGELPIQLNSVKIEGRRYRRGLEAAVLDIYGEVSITAAHAIDTAAAATVHAGVCRWLLRQKIGAMQTGDILACSREIMKAKETRDRAVRLLRLDSRTQDFIDATLYSEDDPENAPDKPPSTPFNKPEGDKGESTPIASKRPVNGEEEEEGKGND